MLSDTQVLVALVIALIP
ncbi:MAG: photosystem I reaction center subunit XII, partial [Microcystis panniformis]